jgi:hypothetical protein
MKRKDKIYSCIDQDELKEAVLHAAMFAERVTGEKYKDVIKIYEGLIEEINGINHQRKLKKENQ